MIACSIIIKDGVKFIREGHTNLRKKSPNYFYIRDHPFKTSACLRGGGVSPCADGPKVTVHKDQKSPS